MGVLDKFLDIMNLDGGDDYDDDDFFDEDDYEDDYDEKPAKRSFFGKKSKEKDDYDDFDFDEEPKAKHAVSNKVTPMRQPNNRSNNNRRNYGTGMEVCVIKPTSVEDSREITETLLSGRTVILNLEGIDLEVAQRIIDFTSGATYAISGNLQKVSNSIFLVTPTNVDISGDLTDLLGGGSSNSFDVPSIKTRY